MCWLRTLKAAKAKSLARMLSWLHFEWALLRMPRRRLPRPDVIVVSSLSLLTVVSGLVLRRRHHARLVVEIRDIWPLTLVEEGGYSPRNPLIRLLGRIERLGYRHADAVVGTMPNLGEHVERVLGRPAPTYCVPMGYAPRLESAERPHAATTATASIPEGAFVVGYAGTVGITNALEPLFLAAEALSADADVHFLVLGDGGLLAEYQRRFAHLPNLSFVAKVPKQDVAAVLDRCDVLYLSTFRSEVWRYGQSLNKLIDYMLAGQAGAGVVLGVPLDDRRGGLRLVRARRGRSRTGRRGAALRRDERGGAPGRRPARSELDPRAPQLPEPGRVVRAHPVPGRVSD